MKKWNTNELKAIRKGTLAGLLLVVVAIVTLEATSITQYLFSSRGMK